MKNILFAIILLINFNSFSQSPVDQIIAKEKEFAEFGKTLNTRKAFLTYISNECVGFKKGYEINLYEDWYRKYSDSSKLMWQTEWALAASSGDMIVTTGPWQYYQNKIIDTPISNGQFATVWKKNENGEYKVYLDFGANFPQMVDTPAVAKKIVIKTQLYRLTYESELRMANDVFAYQFMKDKQVAFNKYPDENCLVVIDGQLPFKGKKDIKLRIDSIPTGAKLKQMGYFYSGVKDLLSTYGNVENTAVRQNFLCIWKRKGDNWKLMLLMIS